MRLTHITKSIAFVALTHFLLTTTAAQKSNDSTLPVGRVVESVYLQTHPEQSYAVFLPSGYTSEKRWPTIFCLDPRARGRIAIDRFVEGATELGYIVLCSNNSRNGLDWQTISNIFSDFWDDAHLRFSIDEKRTYAAGFSGGSRLSATFASRCRGCLTGVIGAGAGFPVDIQPNAKTDFLYFGIVGIDDFNFGEMWELEKKLASLSIPYHFDNFAGGHEWPPAENLKRAMAWFTLQAMKANLAAKDNHFIDTQFTTRKTAAEEFVKTQHWVEAYKAFLSIDRDFSGLRDTKSAVEKADQLRKSVELRKEEKTEEELYRRQLREAGEIRQSWLTRPEPEEVSLPRREATVRLAEWRKKKELPNDSSERRLARRILSHLLIESIESAQSSLRNKDYNVALSNFQLAREVEPKNASVAYEIARVYALKRQKKSALQALEEAIALGFKDANRLKAEEAFTGLADEPRYQKLLSTLSGQ